MRITLVSPRIALQKGDFLGSGVPYWPIELATTAEFLRRSGHEVTVIDLFGLDPRRLEERPDHWLQGASFEARLRDPALAEAELVVVYAISYMSHREVVEIGKLLRTTYRHLPSILLENSQAVTAYALDAVADDIIAAGYDAVVCGEMYWNTPDVLNFVTGRGGARPPNVLTSEYSGPAERLFAKEGSYPTPAWDLFPIENYWQLPYSHGPKTPRFLPVLTSRGCPYPCDFCVVPVSNSKRWRARSPAEVVDEIIFLRDRYKVLDFQVEDLNPTVRASRFREICELLIERRAGISFYIVSGTKAETVHLADIPVLAAAGCKYLSISPESGSEAVMRRIGKRFDYGHGLALVQACRAHGIATQACFLVGHPAETEADFRRSQDYLRRLVESGLDEAAVFVVSPLAGSALHRNKSIPVVNADALVSFSPAGRLDWRAVSRRRRRLIRTFFAAKLRRGPDLWWQGARALFGTPRTKMENLPRRVLFVWTRVLRSRLRALWQLP